MKAPAIGGVLYLRVAVLLNRIYIANLNGAAFPLKAMQLCLRSDLGELPGDPQKATIFTLLYFVNKKQSVSRLPHPGERKPVVSVKAGPSTNRS
jgi:hypothetical protein